MSAIEFTKPARPDFEPIERIHRKHDGYVSFASLDGDNWSEPFSLRANELDGWLPQLMPVLVADSFFTINGQKWASKSPSPYRGLRRGRRSTQNTQYLTSCWADIDCYKLGVEVGTVIGEVINAERAERIPRVSMIMNSGGGVWLFWFICDQLYRDKPLRAHPPAIVNMWAATQRTIFERFARYGADPKSLDAPHVTRVPGSINTKWNESVEYWFHTDHTGTPFAYTLPELVNWFDVFTREIPKGTKRKTKLPKPSGDKDPVKQAAGRKGIRRRWEINLENFNILWNMRGTFTPGMRNEAVRLLVRFMRGTQDFAVPTIWKKANELYQTFDQPSRKKYTHKQFSATVAAEFNPPKVRTKDGSRKRSISYQTCSNLLDVTAEEAAVLNRWLPAKRFQSEDAPPAEPTRTRTQEATRRRLAIRQIVDSLDDAVPTINDMLDRLEKDHDIEPVSTATIMRDLVALKIRTGREHRKKRPKVDTPLLFPKDTHVQ